MRVMRQHKAYRPYWHRHVAKAAKLNRPNEAAVSAAYLLLITGLFIGQLLLLISP